MSNKFDQFIISAVNHCKKSYDNTWDNFFHRQSDSEKKLILQSIGKLDDQSFLRNIFAVMKILPALTNENPKDVSPVLRKIIANDPTKIQAMSPVLLKKFSTVINDSLEANVLAKVDVISVIPKESLGNFTKAINKKIPRSFDIEDMTAMIAIIPKEQLPNYHETLKNVMLDKPERCKSIMPLIPADQFSKFDKTLKTNMQKKTDKCAGIISLIPANKMRDFRSTIEEVVNKNPDKSPEIIREVSKKGDLSNYVETIGNIMRYNPDYCAAIIASVASTGKLKDFDQKIGRVMRENPNKCSNIVQAIPKDQLSRFYKVMGEVIADDHKYNHGQNVSQILSAIPDSKKQEFRKASEKMSSEAKAAINPATKLPKVDFSAANKQTASTGVVQSPGFGVFKKLGITRH